jgi:hypothetical protein
MAFYASFNTPAAANAQVIVKFDYITAAITANLDRADRYTLMTVGTVFFFNSYYLD